MFDRPARIAAAEDVRGFLGFDNGHSGPGEFGHDVVRLTHRRYVAYLSGRGSES